MSPSASLAYKDEIFRAFDREVIRYLPLDHPPGEAGETEAFIRHSLEQIEKGEDLVWVILRSGDFIGCCGLHSITTQKPHFGIWIKKEAHGRGYGQKVVDFVISWAFDHLKPEPDYIKYPVDVRNTPSLKIIEKWHLEPADRYEMGNEKKLDVLEYRLKKQ